MFSKLIAVTSAEEIVIKEIRPKNPFIINYPLWYIPGNTPKTIFWELFSKHNKNVVPGLIRYVSLYNNDALSALVAVLDSKPELLKNTVNTLLNYRNTDPAYWWSATQVLTWLALIGSTKSRMILSEVLPHSLDISITNASPDKMMCMLAFAAASCTMPDLPAEDWKKIEAVLFNPEMATRQDDQGINTRLMAVLLNIIDNKDAFSQTTREQARTLLTDYYKTDNPRSFAVNYWLFQSEMEALNTSCLNLVSNTVQSTDPEIMARNIAMLIMLKVSHPEPITFNTIDDLLDQYAGNPLTADIIRMVRDPVDSSEGTSKSYGHQFAIANANLETEGWTAAEAISTMDTHLGHFSEFLESLGRSTDSSRIREVQSTSQHNIIDSIIVLPWKMQRTMLKTITELTPGQKTDFVTGYKSIHRKHAWVTEFEKIDQDHYTWRIFNTGAQLFYQPPSTGDKYQTALEITTIHDTLLPEIVKSIVAPVSVFSKYTNKSAMHLFFFQLATHQQPVKPGHHNKTNSIRLTIQNKLDTLPPSDRPTFTPLPDFKQACQKGSFCTWKSQKTRVKFALKDNGSLYKQFRIYADTKTFQQSEMDYQKSDPRNSFYLPFLEFQHQIREKYSERLTHYLRSGAVASVNGN